MEVAGEALWNERENFGKGLTEIVPCYKVPRREFSAGLSKPEPPTAVGHGTVFHPKSAKMQPQSYMARCATPKT